VQILGEWWMKILMLVFGDVMKEGVQLLVFWNIGIPLPQLGIQVFQFS